MQLWLKQSPFFILASLGDNGIDCSPRGDRCGLAFHILDANTLAIPDRRGNNRIDTLRNIIKEPRVGLVFLIPGIDYALRIKGQARISIDPNLLERCALEGEHPATVILITVEAAYVQNARAVRSAGLWAQDTHLDTDEIPSVEELLKNLP